ncbi:MAG: hypothetical protein H8E85_08035 [Candidatus Marinimicrobia bacterium]|nr:hypothetical protein [Candidatus Neomarinimicrobiota bacterium]
MKKTALLFFICAMIFCQENNNFTGNLNYFYVSRLSDGSIINLPFRIADFIYQKDEGDFSVYANMAMEYRLPSENHFLVNTSSQDFTWDLRELYLTWFLPIGEIRFGKQINSWGNVDGNSPINNINANDYYYLFSIGTEQKIGSFSTAGELYINNWTFGFSFSPIHNTNRIPLNDIEFPVKMPASPRASQLLEIDNPLEFGGYLSKSFEKGDFTTSYFKGYDRSFGLSGANVYADDNFLYHKLDTVFSYRKTEVLGLGVIYFLGNLTIRGDYAYFNTHDPNENIERSYTDRTANLFGLSTSFTEIAESHPFNVKAEYYEINLQFEYELPLDINFGGQYFKYDTLKYSDTPPPEIDLPELKANIKPSNYFFPGMGAPIAILTKEVIMFDISKLFYDNRIKINIMNMMDQIHSGKLIEFGVTFEINESLKGTFALNKIIGDKTLNQNYSFNNMEEFSNIRGELKYSF